MYRLMLLTALLLLAVLPVSAGRDRPGRPPQPAATPAGSLRALKDFKVELLYSVPKDVEGSWVSLCTDPRGRLIVSDQYGGLFRVTPPPVGGKASETKVEKIDVQINDDYATGRELAALVAQLLRRETLAHVHRQLAAKVGEAGVHLGGHRAGDGACALVLRPVQGAAEAVSEEFDDRQAVPDDDLAVPQDRHLAE